MGVEDFGGLAPVGRAVEKVVTSAVGGVEAALGKLCLPALEEYGLAWRDRVSAWRRRNAVASLQRVEQNMIENKIPDGMHAHPRIAMAIIENCSWTEDSVVQDLWAGLLSSSCTEEGDDESNLIFVNLLGNMTKLQARVVKFACENAHKYIMPGTSFIKATRLTVPVSKLQEVAEEKDIQRLDRELDNLHSTGLLEGGFSPYSDQEAILTPTPLALHMYVRCCGSRLGAVEYFGAKPPPAPTA